MAEYSGSALYLQWVYSGGTVTIHSDFRTFTLNKSITTYDTTAGADSSMTRIAGIKDANWSVNYLAQVGGTATEDAFAEGTEGTLYAGPEGTASGKRKFTLPGIVTAYNINQPYNNVVEHTINWEETAAITDGTY